MTGTPAALWYPVGSERALAGPGASGPACAGSRRTPELLGTETGWRASKSQIFTLIVVSDHTQAVRKFRLPRRWLMNGGYAAAALGSSASSRSSTTSPSSAPPRENMVLREENNQLRAQMQLVQEKVAHITATLDRVERFDAKLRTAVPQLQDPERNLAIGPVGAPEPDAPPSRARRPRPRRR